MKFLKSFLVVLCSIIIFSATTILSLTIITQDIFKKDTLKDIISTVDILEEQPHGIINIKDAHKNLDSTATLKTTINYVARKIKVDDEIFTDIINDKKIQNYIISFIENHSEYLLKDQKKAKLNEDKIFEIIDIILNEYKLSDEQETSIKEFFKLFTDNLDKFMPNKKEIEQASTIFYYIKILNNDLTIPILIFIIIALALVTGLLKDKFYRFLKYGSIPILISGILLTLIGIAGSFLNDIVATNGVNMITGFINHLLDNIFKFGIIIMSISIILLIIYAILKRKFDPETIEEEIIETTIIKESKKEKQAKNNSKTKSKPNTNKKTKSPKKQTKQKISKNSKTKNNE